MVIITITSGGTLSSRFLEYYAVYQMSRGTGNYYTAFDNQVATSSSSSSRSLAAAYLSGQTERERTRLRPKVPEAISTKPTYLKGNMPPPEVQRVPRPPMELPSGEADQTPHKPPPLPNKKRINQS